MVNGSHLLRGEQCLRGLELSYVVIFFRNKFFHTGDMLIKSGKYKKLMYYSTKLG